MTEAEINEAAIDVANEWTKIVRSKTGHSVYLTDEDLNIMLNAVMRITNAALVSGALAENGLPSHANADRKLSDDCQEAVVGIVGSAISLAKDALNKIIEFHKEGVNKPDDSTHIKSMFDAYMKDNPKWRDN